VITTCLLPVALLPYFVITIIPKKNLDQAKMLWLDGPPTQVWGLVFGIIYIIARLFLLVETFRTLGFLPPDAFVATWVSDIPSVG
jgi:hypothetical protein